MGFLLCNMDDKYKKYLQSDEWYQLKIDILEYRGHKCEKCGRTKNLHIHHKHYENIYNEEPEDLIILCGLCHAKAHGIIKEKKKKPKKKKVKKKKQFNQLTRREEINLKKTNPHKYNIYLKKLKDKYSKY